MVIEFADHMTLFEVGGGAERVAAVVKAARQIVPSKPVTEVIVSHHHFDHTAGLRQAVAEGLTVISRRDNGVIFREMTSRPTPNFPDALGRNPRPLKFIPVDDHLQLKDATMTVDIYHVIANNHMADAVFAYIPEHKAMIEGDIATAAEDLQWWGDSWLDNINYRKIDVQLNVPVHMDVMTREQVLKMVDAGHPAREGVLRAAPREGQLLSGLSRAGQVSEDASSLAVSGVAHAVDRAGASGGAWSWLSIAASRAGDRARTPIARGHVVERAAAALGGLERIRSVRNITLTGYAQYAYQFGGGRITGEPAAPEKYLAANELRRVYDLEHDRFQLAERRNMLFPFLAPFGHSWAPVNQVLDGDLAYDIAGEKAVRVARESDNPLQVDGVHVRRMLMMTNPVVLVRAMLEIRRRACQRRGGRRGAASST